jgi:hypothetical protein
MLQQPLNRLEGEQRKTDHETNDGVGVVANGVAGDVGKFDADADAGDGEEEAENLEEGMEGRNWEVETDEDGSDGEEEDEGRGHEDSMRNERVVDENGRMAIGTIG